MSVTRTCAACGYSHDYPTTALADAHHARHSCARQRRLAAATQRRVARAAGGVRRDCTHLGHPHAHGSRVAYVKDRCRCPACTAANTGASHTTTRARTFGRWAPYVDAGSVRAHIQLLRRAGIGYDQIARLSGTSSAHIREITGTVARSANRPAIRRIRQDRATKIMAVAPIAANRAAHSQIDATGTRRRLQALVAMGWPTHELAAQLGRTTAGVRRTLTAATVTVLTAQLVNDLYDRLWDTRVPQATDAQRRAAAAAHADAREHGWLPPLAWDDIDTDPDPGPAAPHAEADAQDLDEIAVERAVAGDGIHLRDLTPTEQAEVVRRLTARGKSIRDIADQLATTKRTVSRRRESAASAA